MVTARSRDQARIVFDLAASFTESLDDETRALLTHRRSPQLELELDDESGPHVLRGVPAIARNVLGLSPTLAIMDERGSWEPEKGQELEDSLLSGLSKRGGRAVMISTSAADDRHSFSKWIDEPPPGTSVQEHRPGPGLPVDDRESLLVANPGAEQGIGSSLEWLQNQAQRAKARGGSALTSFRNLNRNERVSAEACDALLSVDQWLACEIEQLPQREGKAVVGVDLGGSMSMTAAALFWPATGRLEAFGAFPGELALHDRGSGDGVGNRYDRMAEAGELITLGDRVVPVDQFLRRTVQGLGDSPVACLVSDRFRQAELEEALTRAELNIPVVYRGMGYRDGAEDVERFRQSVFDEKVAATESLLLRSAFADAVTVSDEAGNQKIAKGRARGRIDAAAAAVLAVAHGQRIKARASKPVRDPVWA